jgi:hypothetical protein
MSYQFEVALSFAGEDRAFAESIAEGLLQAGIEVFYDDYYAADLWGEDLTVKLREIYYAGSRYCIMVLSEPYIDKMWTSFERQQAIERLIEQRGEAYILPVRLDGFDDDVPGLSGAIVYLSVSSSDPGRVVETFLRKIGRDVQRDSVSSTTLSSKLHIPKLKRAYTDKDKNRFLRESFGRIVELISHLVSETGKQYPHFEHELDTVTSRKVIFTLYNLGKELTRFKIWFGGMLGEDSICLSHGSHIDIDSDTSMNESISIVEHAGELKLKPMGIAMFGGEKDKLMSPRDAAEYIWRIVCRTLEGNLGEM